MSSIFISFLDHWRRKVVRWRTRGEIRRHVCLPELYLYVCLHIWSSCKGRIIGLSLSVREFCTDSTFFVKKEKKKVCTVSILKKGNDTPRQPRTFFAFDCYLLGRFSTDLNQICHGGSCRAGSTPREIRISKFRMVAMEIGKRGHTQAASDI